MTTSPEDGAGTRYVRQPAEPATHDFDEEQTGYRSGMKARHLRMIAIGGAIGTGLFLGAGSRLHEGGPFLVVIYAICGFFAFLVLRALGELVMHRPSSGSFVSYAREFYGEKMAFAVGWMYFFHWAMTAIVDCTAVALYVKYWSAFSAVPQWLLALVALPVVVGLNLISARMFGETEFWFALVKVGALVVFLVIGIVVLAARRPTDAGETGVPMLAAHGGLLPHGAATVGAALVLTQGVVLAFAGTELVSIAAGETTDPRKTMPRAINSVIVRLAVFYCGSVLLLALLLPSQLYSGSQSPFVTFFSHFGGPRVSAAAGTAMNFVVLTAVLSSLNAGLYSTGRILHSLAQAGAAPRFFGRMNRRGVPYGGILLTGAIGLLGVGLNYLAPSRAFEIALNTTSLGVLTSWATIVLCQIRLRRWSLQGRVERPAFRLFGAPVTAYLALGFLAAVLVLIAFDRPTGSYTMALVPLIAALLVLGWYRRRGYIAAAAADRRPPRAAPTAADSRRSSVPEPRP
ncbi:amino acid permease [Streptomyces sp. 8L]|uniref:amino acid permease n=1 Tax=Streptomyces sp. 8L TaxID=2877242 RepID=UPI001CD67052|nr:amino acid permease [Streptomyces sp. 8L]MCA1217035.1 amino acid permease [Streptomyces sp. 8L]